MNISFHDKILTIDDRAYEMHWPILDAVERDSRVIVLLDPDSYLLDPGYKALRRQGAPAIKNLIAVSSEGKKLWEAEFPEISDYYYRISSVTPLMADSFSSYRSQIDINTGKIISKEFLK